MDRERFVRENPELAKEQEKSGNRGVVRVITLVCLGTALYIGADKYCKDEEFRTKVNDISVKLYYESLRRLG